MLIIQRHRHESMAVSCCIRRNYIQVSDFTYCSEGASISKLSKARALFWVGKARALYLLQLPTLDRKGIL